MNQPIYAGGRVRAQIALSGLSAQASAEDVRNTRQQLVVETDQTYWQAVALRDQVVLAQGNRAQLQALVRDLDNKFQAGMGYKADLLRSQVQLRDAEVRLLRTRDDQRVSQLVLRQLIGRPPATRCAWPSRLRANFRPSAPPIMRSGPSPSGPTCASSRWPTGPTRCKLRWPAVPAGPRSTAASMPSTCGRSPVLAARNQLHARLRRGQPEPAAGALEGKAAA
ncbi:MAG: TolC family protein [Hymenobacter sp.]